MQADDHDLIARVLAVDDRHAFGELVRRHQSAVRGFVRRLAAGDHALADDIAQEAFIEAYRSLAKFNGRSSLSTWLCGIAYNRFRNHRRSQHEYRTAPAAVGEGATVSDEPSPARQFELREDLAAALARLSPEEQTALHLCYTQGLSHDDAATMLGWPLGTLKSHILRGRAALRNHLRDWTPR